MGILLIVVGAALLICGIVMVSTNNASTKPSQPKVVVAEKHVQDSMTASAPAQPMQPAIEIGEIGESKDAELSKKEKGNQFENFVANCFTDRNIFRVLEWNQGTTSTEGVYAESNVNPDFKIKHKFSDSFECTYWVECKYQTRRNNGALTFHDYQIERYRIIQRNSHVKVFMAVGVGGTPDAPASFYLIPLDSIKDHSVAATELSQYYLSEPHTRLAAHIKHYFQTKVFPASRKHK